MSVTHIDNGLDNSDNVIWYNLDVKDKHKPQLTTEEENHWDLNGQENQLRDYSSLSQEKNEGCAWIIEDGLNRFKDDDSAKV